MGSFPAQANNPPTTRAWAPKLASLTLNAQARDSQPHFTAEPSYYLRGTSLSSFWDTLASRFGLRHVHLEVANPSTCQSLSDRPTPAGCARKQTRPSPPAMLRFCVSEYVAGGFRTLHFIHNYRDGHGSFFVFWRQRFAFCFNVRFQAVPRRAFDIRG
jgi:hypothetical protein